MEMNFIIKKYGIHSVYFRVVGDYISFLGEERRTHALRGSVHTQRIWQLFKLPEESAIWLYAVDSKSRQQFLALSL